ncbi:DUF4185 domain-containing protein [Mycolicibacterium sp. P1-5]|uniref:DUF4185 domain-containing protein n=1 Tax=Mycolicibacterium sp. P1-5 TaxID=2024617 RepID=UPI0011EF3C89|nr:DUF4185 domain-containing protein [Mycolicibacterium sp. P1-5]KAA0108175.1 DUF4185 domain-containing protein [Mycolicibacterium sp. P1-5]
MRTAAYIGGIGGFAVALGVGAAVTAGCGVASADSVDSGSGPKSSATHSSSTARSAVGHAQRTKPATTAAPRQNSLPVNQTRTVVSKATAAAVATSPVTTKVGWVTGPNTSTPSRFGIYGTDVGIMWDNGMAGDKRQVLTIFGDTFSGPGMSGNWRSNVLLRTTDPINRVFAPGSTTDPFAGSPLSSPGMSKQAIAGSARNLGLFGSQVTVIPTAAISVPYDNQYGARQYVNFMSVRSWDFGGAWTTNYSAIAYSDDNGQNWTVAPQTIRAASWLRSSTPFMYGNQNFQQGAFVKPPTDSPDAGYVFSYGTPSGRFGSAYVSRVKEADILDLTKYDYWDGNTWVTGDPNAAVPILPTRGNQYAGGFLGQLGLLFGGWVAGLFGVGGPNGHVSEMSVQYNTYLDKYVAMYSDGIGSVVIRTADSPQGAWSDATTLVTSLQYPGLYAPMMDPWSTGQDIYWNLSQWGSYNVMLMKTTLGAAAIQASAGGAKNSSVMPSGSRKLSPEP